MNQYAFVVSLGLLLVCGCGDSTPQATVSGKVTKGGAGLSGVTVSFLGDNGAGSAVTDGSGNFKMPTTIAAGKYRVSLTQASSANIDTTSAEYEKLMSGGAPAAAPAPSSGIDAKYQSFSSSGLQYDLNEGENAIDIAI